MGVCFHFASNSLSHSQSSGASEAALHPLALREAEGFCTVRQRNRLRHEEEEAQCASVQHLGGAVHERDPLLLLCPRNTVRAEGPALLGKRILS